MHRSEQVRKSLVTLIIAITATAVVYANNAHMKLETKHNFGFTLQRMRQVRLSVATGHLLFLYKLPVGELNISLVDPRFVVQDSANRRHPVNVTAILGRNWNIITQLHKTRLESIQYVQRLMNILSELLTDVPTMTGRLSKRSWWSSAWSFVTGLAEAEDVEKVQQVVKRIEAGVAHAASVWKSGSQTFLAAIQIERKRVDSLKTVLEATRASLWELHDQFSNAYLDVRVKTRILGQMMHNLRRMMMEVMEIDHVYNAVSSMTAGRMSHFLLPHQQLESSLQWFQEYLEQHHSNLFLLHTDLQYYYRHAVFHVFKHNNHLVINTDVPLTVRGLLHDMIVYRIRPIPLSSPDGDQRHHTKLHLDFDAVIHNVDAQYYAVVYDLQELPAHEVINLQSSSLTLRSRDYESCALMLMEGNLRQIQTHCRYDLVLSPLPTSMLKVSEHWVLLSNITEMALNCPAHNHSAVIKLEKLQSLYYLSCGCTISAGTFVMIESSIECTDNDNITAQQTAVRHIANLPYITAFVEQSWLHEIAADQLFNVSVTAQFPPLQIEDPKYTHLLAADAQRSVDMDRAINRSKESVTVFGDLADYLYSAIVSEKQLPGGFSWFSAWTWVTIITSAVAAFSLFLGVTQHLKIKSLYLLVATLQKGHALPSGLVVNYVATTTPSTGVPPTDPGFQQYVKMVTDVVPAELTLILILLCIVAGVLGYMLYRKCKPNVMGPHLYVEIGTKLAAYRIKIAELRYGASNYKLTVNQDVVRMEVIQKYVYSVLRWSDVITLQNKLLGIPLTLPTEAKLPPWHCFTIQALLATQHYVAVQFVGSTGNILDAAVLKTWRNGDDKAGCSAGLPPGARAGAVAVVTAGRR